MQVMLQQAISIPQYTISTVHTLRFSVCREFAQNTLWVKYSRRINFKVSTYAKKNNAAYICFGILKLFQLKWILPQQPRRWKSFDDFQIIFDLFSSGKFSSSAKGLRAYVFCLNLFNLILLFMYRRWLAAWKERHQRTHTASASVF
jgi:hypothetical protein